MVSGEMEKHYFQRYTNQIFKSLGKSVEIYFLDGSKGHGVFHGFDQEQKMFSILNFCYLNDEQMRDPIKLSLSEIVQIKVMDVRVEKIKAIDIIEDFTESMINSSEQSPKHGKQKTKKIVENEGLFQKNNRKIEIEKAPEKVNKPKTKNKKHLTQKKEKNEELFQGYDAPKTKFIADGTTPNFQDYKMDEFQRNSNDNRTQMINDNGTDYAVGWKNEVQIYSQTKKTNSQFGQKKTIFKNPTTDDFQVGSETLKKHAINRLRRPTDPDHKINAFQIDSEISKKTTVVISKKFHKFDLAFSDNLQLLESEKLTKFDQFEINKELYKIGFDFNENDYSTKLDINQVSSELKEKAIKIEKEILKDSSDKTRHILEERGLVNLKDNENEEELYSSVSKNAKAREIEKKNAINNEENTLKTNEANKEIAKFAFKKLKSSNLQELFFRKTIEGNYKLVVIRNGEKVESVSVGSSGMGQILQNFSKETSEQSLKMQNSFYRNDNYQKKRSSNFRNVE